MRRPPQVALVRYGQHHHGGREQQHDQQLPPRRLLDRLSRLPLTYFPRTILHLVFKEERIELTPETDTKRRFEKEEDQTGQTNKSRQQPIGIHQYEKDEHGCRQDQANNPGKLFLPGPYIFGCLAPYDQPTDDQRRGESRVDKYTDDKISEKNDEDIP